eukprot:TRINITY_DN10328_c0_g1_i1.p1 TRINITY_DN10328_c0_g1~~TRINITY_DN10328_c0_g1_i1.p1  ORF type:complete len:281 (-),score=40.97 TRINITY_DN10328_c0_g1_i1:48-890(-)
MLRRSIVAMIALTSTIYADLITPSTSYDYIVLSLYPTHDNLVSCTHRDKAYDFITPAGCSSMEGLGNITDNIYLSRYLSCHTETVPVANNKDDPLARHDDDRAHLLSPSTILTNTFLRDHPQHRYRIRSHLCSDPLCQACESQPRHQGSHLEEPQVCSPVLLGYAGVRTCIRGHDLEATSDDGAIILPSPRFLLATNANNNSSLAWDVDNPTTFVLSFSNPPSPLMMLMAWCFPLAIILTAVLSLMIPHDKSKRDPEAQHDLYIFFNEEDDFSASSSDEE